MSQFDPLFCFIVDKTLNCWIVFRCRVRWRDRYLHLPVQTGR